MTKEKVYYWPDWLWASFNPRRPFPSSRLPAAQTYLWRAMNIYDDFLDGHPAPSRLILANSYFRRFLEIIYQTKLPPVFFSLFREIFSDFERSNQEEMKEKRLDIIAGKIVLSHTLPPLPDSLMLARKSLVLALAPLAATYPSGWSNRLEAERIINFFRLALAAKQLSDDARDWEEDLRAGRLTAATAHILIKAAILGKNLDLKKRPEIPRLLFAASTIQLGREIQELCQKARKAGIRLGWKPDCAITKGLISPLEAAVQETNKFRRLLAKGTTKMV